MNCPICGNVLNENDKFCINCGTPVVKPETAPAPEPEPTPVFEEPAPMPEPDPVIAPEPVKEPEPIIAPEPVTAPAPSKLDKPLTTWGYLWRMFIFALPILGLIPLFVCAFAQGINKNSKGLSRAILIGLLVVLVLAIAGVIALLCIVRDPAIVKDYLKGIFDSITTLPKN
ncbi:MAG: zinc-ribbon domain-containing protein [Clostridiales bacterium]|nr:zinc-ribbon domain-containing protein [Clostridiales bacterium]